MTAINPGMECLTGKHLHIDIHDGNTCVGGWCIWCGGATYDGDRITDDGQAIGFTPTYRLRVPDGWRRDPADWTAGR